MTAPPLQNAIRLGLVGLGWKGRYHRERLGLRDDYRIVAIHDANSAAAAAFPTLLDCFQIDFAALLAAGDLEAVLIATPPESHAPLALAALRAGKHVLVERPLAPDLRDADAMLRAAESAQRSLCVLHSHRWDGDFATAAGVLQAGRLGRLQSARLIARQFAPPLPGDDSRPAGILQRFGPQYVDQMLQLFGEVPRRVDARLTCSAWSPGTPDSFLLWSEFADGRSAQIDVSVGSPAPQQTGWLLHGDQGDYARGRHYRASVDGEVIDVPIEPQATQPDALYDAFSQHLRQGTPLPVTPIEARAVVAVLTAAEQSAASGDWIPVDSGTGRFISDQIADEHT